jgi:hypothetical protein
MSFHGLKRWRMGYGYLTTVEGIQYNFDPSTVVAVSDDGPATGQAVTCVYGVMVNYLKINESIQEFLSRLKITTNFALLTGPNGASIWMNGSSASAIRGLLLGDAPGVNAVVYTSSISQGVKESVGDAIAALDAHGGKL